MPDLPSWLPPFLGLIVGYLLKALSDWLQHRYMSAREREAREEARRERLFEKRTLFQRETLLDLQQAMNEFVEVVRAIHLQAAGIAEKTRTWPGPLTLDVAAEYDRGEALMAKFLVRVRDDQVRLLGGKVRKEAMAWFDAVSASSGIEVLHSTAAAVAVVNERIGVVLRQLDDDLG